MNRNQIRNIFDKIENSIWTLQYYSRSLLKKKECSILKNNRAIKNKYEGQTCFILGNGPSLKKEKNLSQLKDEIVFSVNQFYRSEYFDIIQPKYHVMVDPLFFNLHDEIESERDTLERMRRVAKLEKVKMIMPVSSYEYIAKEIGNADHHIYIKNRLKMCEGYSRNIDMSKYIPGSYNVVQTAIYCAIYMGFKRIVLLGCDMTGLLDHYISRSENSNTEKFSHVYEYTEQEKERMRNVHASNSNEVMLNGFYNMFRDYRLIREYCNRKGVEIVNATRETALDNLPFTTLDEELI